MKKALIIGTTQLYDIQQELFLVCCGECDMLFHIQKEEKSKIIKCPICKKEVELE